MSRPVVFISYARRADVEGSPYRSAIRAVERHLEAVACQPYRDARSVPVGEAWFEHVHEHLGRCRAALVFIAPEALESDWVHYEWMALCNRQRFESDFPLIPITFGLSAEQVHESRLGPMGLNRLSFQDGVTPTPDALAASVVSLLGDIARWTEAPPVVGWVGTMATLLREVDDGLVAQLRGEPASTKPSLDRQALARRWLHAPRSGLEAACRTLEAALAHRPGVLHRLAELMRPLWVRFENVQMLPQGHRPGESGPWMVARLSTTEAGRDHVRRAWLTSAHHRLVISGPVEAPDDELIEDLTRRLAEKLGLHAQLRRRVSPDWSARLGEPGVAVAVSAAIDDRARALGEQEPPTPLVLLLPPGYAARAAVLAHIRRRFPCVVPVVLERDPRMHRAFDGDDHLVVAPELSLRDEEDGLDWADTLIADLLHQTDDTGGG